MWRFKQLACAVSSVPRVLHRLLSSATLQGQTDTMCAVLACVGNMGTDKAVAALVPLRDARGIFFGL